MNGEQELPEGWAFSKLAEIVENIPNIKPEKRPKTVFRYVDISSIDNRLYRLTEAKPILGIDVPSRARRPIRPGDVLFSNVRTYLRNIAIVPDGSNANVCSTGFTVLRAGKAVNPDYLFRYVLTADFIDRVTPEQTGTHYPATSDRVVLDQVIPLPPLAEQRRIVAAVEAVLAKVNAARERLNRVPAILKRFRQAILSAACSGRLTADWRKDDNHLGDNSPSKWQVVSLGSISTRVTDGTHQPPPLAERGGIPSGWGKTLPEIRLLAGFAAIPESDWRIVHWDD